MIESVDRPHRLITIGQEMQCTQCRRRWDFDEPAPEDEECDAPPKEFKASSVPAPRRRRTMRRRKV